MPLSEETKNLPEYNLSGKRADAELLFKVELPPLGSKAIRIKQTALRYNKKFDNGKEMIGNPFTLENSVSYFICEHYCIY